MRTGDRYDANTESSPSLYVSLAYIDWRQNDVQARSLPTPGVIVFWRFFARKSVTRFVRYRKANPVMDFQRTQARKKRTSKL